ncbi:MAG: recombinase family protein [Acidaminococcaceae bacterium]|nr:recombinase family protein [Acidaminococcaceae bacterium]
MRVAYIRVSSVDQNLDRQRLELDENKIEKWFEEKASGKDTERPELKRMLEFLREGDTLYISDFSRLARSVVDLLKICDELNRKNVKLVSMKEKIDTNTNEGRLMLTVIGAIAEFERAIIRERQAEGIAIAKAKGRYAGRKPMKINQDFFDECYRLWKNRKMTLVDLAKRLNVSRSTAYRLIKQREEKDALQEFK